MPNNIIAPIISARLVIVRISVVHYIHTFKILSLWQYVDIYALLPYTYKFSNDVNIFLDFI